MGMVDTVTVDTVKDMGVGGLAAHGWRPLWLPD
jgi:hypothetical protein